MSASESGPYKRKSCGNRQLVRELRLAGIFPGGEPVGSDVGGGVGDLADEHGAGLIIEVVVIFVGVSVEAAAGIAIGVKNGFEPAVGAEAGLESVVGGIGDIHGIVGMHEEK